MNGTEYFSKMKGGAKSPPAVGVGELLWSWAGAVIGIGICGYLSSKYFEPRDLTLLIGSFGASAVLVYGAIKKIIGIRLDPEEEFNGADLSIHRITATPERESGW
jgi:ammonia channel protein AmtB